MRDEAMSKQPVEPTLYRRLSDHFPTPLAQLPVLTQEFADYERPNLQLALAELLAAQGASATTIGVVCREWERPSLAKLSRPKTASEFLDGAVEFTDVTLAAVYAANC